MTKSKTEIELSPGQVELLSRVLASIRSGKRFTSEEFEDYIYVLRDMSIGIALEKRLTGNKAFLGDLTAAERLHEMVRKYEADHGGNVQADKEVMEIVLKVQPEDDSDNAA